MIKEAFFSEFDIHAGPIISWKMPGLWEEMEQVFEHYKNIIIPIPELCFKNGTVELEDYIILVFRDE